LISTRVPVSNRRPLGLINTPSTSIKESTMTRYIVTLNYVVINPASPLFGTVRTTHRAYDDLSGPAATITARSNFMATRNPNNVKIVSTDVHDKDGRYAY
jgi:hypothetical protein